MNFSDRLLSNMKDLEACLLKLIKTSDQIAVFPSEVALQYWQRELLKNGEIKAIALNRFISWDRFKSMCLGYPEKQKRVNQVARFLFLIQILSQNKNEGIFKQIIPAEFQESSILFYKTFLPYLPMLDKIEKINVPGDIENWLKKKKDLLHLLKEYKSFLDSNNLFEPNFVKPSLTTQGLTFYIIFPELIDDFGRFSSLLNKSKNIKLFSYDKLKDNEHFSFTAYTNLEEEYDDILLEISSLLDQGIPPWEIMISSCSDPSLLDGLVSKAKLYDVPLFLHQGSSVSKFQSVKIFTQLINVYSNNYSYQSLREMLSNHSIPWKDSLANKRLLDFGMKAKCFIQESDSHDMWKKAFEFYDKNRSDIEDLKIMFYSLKKHIKGIVSASSFLSLKEKIMAWVQDFIDTQAWADEALKTFQFALKSLDELQDSIDALSIHFENNPLSLWLKYLEDKIYVERPDKFSVSVYSYRVSAGTYPSYHYIVQTSQKRIQVIEKNYPYLDSHEETFLSDSQNDMTLSFLKIYSYSGKQVKFTYSETDYNGTNLVPAKLLESGNLQPFDNELAHNKNSYMQEILAWKKKADLKKLHSVQADSLNRAKQTILLKHNQEFFSMPFSADYMRELIDNSRDAKGWFRISYYDIESFLNCPLQFFLLKFFYLDDKEESVDFFSPMEQGNLVHDLFCQFYKKIKEEKLGPVSRLKPELAMEIMDDAVATTRKKYLLESPNPPQTVWAYFSKKLSEQARSFLSNELEYLGDSEIKEIEMAMELPRDDGKIKLVGRVDRLSKSDDGLVLIDYKRNVRVKQDDVIGEEMNSYQLPFYLLLLKEYCDEPIDKAGYYDFSKGKYSFILDSKESGSEIIQARVDALILQVEQNLQFMLEEIQSGRFSLSGNEPSCEYCEARALCRKKFSLG